MKLFNFNYCVYIILLIQRTESPDPITVGVGGVGLAGLYAGFHYVKCKMYECCTNEWIKPNFTGLEQALSSRLHGQHLVKEVALKSLRVHMMKRDPKKPLVISFNGWTGGGKTFVSGIIAEHLFTEGVKSKFVHKFSATTHFPHKSLLAEYQDNLASWIRGNVSECEQSLFIFDEVDKMPPGLFESIKAYLDYHEHVDGINYRRAVYILLSNHGGRDITNIALDYWKKGKIREEIPLHELHKVLTTESFNSEGGLKHSSVIDSHLIDHYIPFLPLERRHIELCIADELTRRKLPVKPSFVKKVVDKLSFGPQDLLLYSTSGCKRIEKLIDLHLEDDFKIH